jgi:DNA gyrase/topoisomerase IV subunit A
VNDVKDESAESVRVVLELKDGKVDPEKVKTFLFKHTDMEINFPLNFTCLTPSATPERLSIKEILNHFLDFRKEVIVGKLEFEKTSLERRIHILLGFMKIFVDLDAAIAIIRVALDRQEAHDNLKARFDLDDEQAKAILDLRLHALVRMEVSKIEEELAGKEKRLKQIKTILASRARIWKEVRKEIAELKKAYGDKRLTAVIAEGTELTYDKEDFVIHEDVYVVISRNGWLKRVKSYDPSTQMLKEGDEVLVVIRSNTKETVAFFSNFGKVYVSRVYDLDVSGKGYGDPIQTVFNFQDGEKIVAALAAEPGPGPVVDISFMVQSETEGGQVEPGQLTFFPDLGKDAEPGKRAVQDAPPPLCLVVTRQGMGFCFERSSLKDPSTKAGRTLIRLRSGDEVVGVRPVERPLLSIATSRRILVMPMVQVNVLVGAGRGVRLIKPDPPGVRDFFTVDQDDFLIIRNKKGKERETAVAELPVYNRGAKGAVSPGGIEDVQLKSKEEELAGFENDGDSEDEPA